MGYANAKKQHSIVFPKFLVKTTVYIVCPKYAIKKVPYGLGMKIPVCPPGGPGLGTNRLRAMF